MYEDLLGERPEKPKEPKNKVNVKEEEEIDLEMDVGSSSVPEDTPESKVKDGDDPWKGVADDLDLEDLEDMDDCDGDCDNCDLECADQDDENPEGCLPGRR